MTDDIINTVLFYFFCGTLDVLVTIIVIFYGIGIEGNPVWSWIQPKERLAMAIVLGNLLICTFFLFISYYIPQQSFYKKILIFGLCGEGIGRIAFGVIPGILLMKEAGWF